MLRHLAWNQLKHMLHKLASWLFLTALSHSPQGYFGGTLVPLGPGLDEMSPQTSSFLSKLKLLIPLVVYWILHEVNRLTRDLDLRYVVEFRTSSVARSVWKTLPTCSDRDMMTLSVFSLMVVAVINKKARIRRELEQVWPAAMMQSLDRRTPRWLPLSMRPHAEQSSFIFFFASEPSAIQIEILKGEVIVFPCHEYVHLTGLYCHGCL